MVKKAGLQELETAGHLIYPSKEQRDVDEIPSLFPPFCPVQDFSL